MKRYFYTDPLAAAWMSKHFEMKFEWPGPEVSWENDRIFFFQCDWDGQAGEREGPFYIHPDSLPLLEPREGDTICSGQGKYHFICGSSGIFGTSLASLPQIIGPQGMKQMWIIQRNGIAFHWPASEDV